MIISEDHILQEDISNPTGILLARAYPLHLVIKNITKPSSTPAVPLDETHLDALRGLM